MPAQMISYDLSKPGQDYGNLHDAIKKQGKTWHYLESTWIVITSKNAAQVRDALKAHLDPNDRLLVTRLSGGWASCYLPQKANRWLRENL